MGSWIWRTLLKYRPLVKEFSRVEVRNGISTSFWFDNWCTLACVYDKLGDRGPIALGIPLSSYVADVLNMPRRRAHRQPLLNLIEEEIRKCQSSRTEEADITLWKGKNDAYRSKFSTNDTWLHIHEAKPVLDSHKAICFPHATPKFAFVTWLVVKNRLSTGERMHAWNQNIDPKCVLCSYPLETREHLFFECPFSQRVWEKLIKGILQTRYTTSWLEVLNLVTGNVLEKSTRFLLGYTFQNTIHSLWRERNDRRHGETPSTAEKLSKLIDKNVRNRLSTIGGGNSLQDWFATRSY